MVISEIEYVFDLHLTADEYLQYYQGVVNAIQVRSRCGKRVQFSADKIRQFVMAEGIHGTFKIKLGPYNKLIEIKRI